MFVLEVRCFDIVSVAASVTQMTYLVIGGIVQVTGIVGQMLGSKQPGM
jgi:hypothetical protein